MKKLETGFVCCLCGKEAGWREVLDKKSDCCGGRPILSEDYLPQDNLFKHNELDNKLEIEYDVFNW